MLLMLCVNWYEESREFQWAPTLGGECYFGGPKNSESKIAGFNGHPPLGVNATNLAHSKESRNGRGFNGHPPLGVNATFYFLTLKTPTTTPVSMGTHPWG